MKQRSLPGTFVLFLLLSLVVPACGRDPASGEARIGVELSRTAGCSFKRVQPGYFNSAVGTNGVFNATGTLRWLIAKAYNVDESQIEPARLIPGGTYNLVIRVGPGGGSDNAFREALSLVLRDAFAITLRRDSQMRDTYILRLQGSNTPGALTPTRFEAPYDGRTGVGYEFRATSMAGLAAFMQRHLRDIPVLDRTQLAGQFDFILRDYTPPDRDNLISAVERLGLKVEPFKRQADLLLVERKGR